MYSTVHVEMQLRKKKVISLYFSFTDQSVKKNRQLFVGLKEEQPNYFPIKELIFSFTLPTYNLPIKLHKFIVNQPITPTNT